MKRHFVLMLAAIALGTAGCQYYRVTDPGSGREYYTNNWMMQRSVFGSGLEFKDLETGDTVTLQAHELHRVSHDQVPLHP